MSGRAADPGADGAAVGAGYGGGPGKRAADYQAQWKPATVFSMNLR